MEQDELQRIRAARLAELQAQHSSSMSGGQQRGVPAGNAASAAGGTGSGEDKSEEQAAQRHGMLSQILDSSARDRLRRIALVKADRARAIEDLVLDMARRGQIRQRVTEPELVGLLEEISSREKDNETAGGSGAGRGKISFQRRRDSFDDDWD